MRKCKDNNHLLKKANGKDNTIAHLIFAHLHDAEIKQDAVEMPAGV